jgi:hypothetical protein
VNISILGLESAFVTKDARVEIAMPKLQSAPSGAIAPNLDANRVASDPDTLVRCKD